MITNIGKYFIKYCVITGGIFILFLKILKNLHKTDYKQTVSNLYSTGINSLPIVFMTAIFVGAIMVIQTGFYVREFQMNDILGWGVGFFSFREISPLMIGLMVSGRIGANTTAEIGNMKINEQIDMLKSFSINPVQYIVVPKFVSIVVMMCVLVVLGDFITILTGIAAGNILLNIDSHIFLSSFFAYIKNIDFIIGVVKAAVFGVIISVISCYFGLNVGNTSRSIGKNVSKSVIFIASSIFIIDYFLTSLFEL